MIITRTPFRISFFGGGTDYPIWYRKNGGAVLAASIDKYCYINCRRLPPFFKYKYKIVYTKIEECQKLAEIKHPVIPPVVKKLAISHGLEIHHDADLPARSGMGSSSSFVAGLLKALHAYKGDHISKEQLLKESIDIEQNVLSEDVGSQDQTTAVYGGLNHIRFLPTGHIQVNPLTVPISTVHKFNDNLLLFYTGKSRRASEIAATYVPTLREKEKQLNQLSQLVDEALAILASGKRLRDFGRLLHETWEIKKSLSKNISTCECDEIYEKARKAGSLGGKMLGAGGGGFMLFFVPPEKQANVKRALKKLINVPFRFEFMGSQIVHYEKMIEYEN